MTDLELLDVARSAARAAAPGLLARFGSRAAGVEAKSSPTDLVSADVRDDERSLLVVL